ncbi:MAG TPA: endolytic transglycosylase MltG [Acidimicrobiales bacterium]|nr:endolytic transglycosylase MltG [Acidimicrobiales bacterium]
MALGAPFDLDEDTYGVGERRRWPFVVLGVLLALLIVGGITVGWIKAQINPSGPPGQEVAVTVTEGMSTSDIAKLLQREGVISNATVFTYYARFKGADSIKAGEFTLHRNEDMGVVLDTLERGAEVQTQRLTIPEGLTLKEVAAKVGELPGRSPERFLAAAQNGVVRSQLQPPGSTNLEGLILPETYFVDPKDDEAKILARMVNAFDDHANRVGLPAAAARLRLTPYQLVIVASLVEREARVDEDRAPIARVIYNRLARGMPLEIDATVQYALGKQKERLLLSDLEIASPYNTYKIPGLPPGPIASPGRSVLDAVLDPPPSPYLFYVLADANGKHAFSATGEEHARRVAEARAKGLL